MHIYNAIQSFLVFKLKNLFVQVMKLVSFGANLLVGLAYCYYWRTEYIIFWNIASQTCGLSFISPTTNKNECANLSKKFLIVLTYTRHFVCRWICSRTFLILLPVLILTVWEPRRPVWVGVRHQTITASSRESTNLHVFSTICYFMKW